MSRHSPERRVVLVGFQGRPLDRVSALRDVLRKRVDDVTRLRVLWWRD